MCDSVALCACGYHYPEMEFVAIRENMKLEAARQGVSVSPEAGRNTLAIQHPGVLGEYSGGDYSGVCAF